MKNLPKIKEEIEDLAIRFATKLPNETNFNNNKTKKYFERNQNKSVKNGTLSSSETIKMSYKSYHRSTNSMLSSEKSHCK